jgi:NAD dependent epimerase/dehydratase family enzyme
MSTATIYAHRFDAPNDEITGIIGGAEPDAPADWGFSIRIAREWESTLNEAPAPRTRKVALRSSMVMSPDPGGIFDVLVKLVRRGLGGPVAGGQQFVSWIDHRDFVRALRFLVARDDLDGPINLASPHPLPYAEFMKALRDASNIRIGLPATRWMLAMGAWAMRTETELVLKSRRVVPRRLLDAGFTFDHPDWPDAARDLVASWRAHSM